MLHLLVLILAIVYANWIVTHYLLHAHALAFGPFAKFALRIAISCITAHLHKLASTLSFALHTALAIVQNSI